MMVKNSHLLECVWLFIFHRLKERAKKETASIENEVDVRESFHSEAEQSISWMRKTIASVEDFRPQTVDGTDIMSKFSVGAIFIRVSKKWLQLCVISYEFHFVFFSHIFFSIYISVAVHWSGKTLKIAFSKKI